MILPRFRDAAGGLSRRLAVLATILTPALVHGQASTGGDLLVLLSGNDTLSVERVQRGPAALDGELLLKAANARFTFRVEIDPQGGATRLQNSYRPAAADAASEPLQRANVSFTGDSVIAELTGGGRTSTQRFATRPGALPFLNPSFALLELVVHQARLRGGDSVSVPVWMIQGGQTAMAAVVRRGGDSMVVTMGNIPVHLAVNAAGDITGGSIPAQSLRLVRVKGGGASGMSVERPDYSAPRDAPYTAEDVTIPTPSGHTLAGTLTLPTGGRAPFAAVVTITGSGPQDRDEAIPSVKGYRLFRQVSDTLGRHGIAVLRFDDRGWGTSTGNHATATSADFADDVRAALAYLRKRPEIDGRRLGLVGHSEGGLIAPIVAATDTSLRAIVLMAGPSQNGRQILRFQMREGIGRAPSLSSAQRDSALRTVETTIDSLGKAQPWVRFFLDHDPLATARRVRVPTLILQGATDRQVTAEQAEALERAIRAGGNEQVTTHVFPEANHLFVQDTNGAPEGYGKLPNSHVRADVLGTLVSWLTRTMR